MSSGLMSSDGYSIVSIGAEAVPLGVLTSVALPFDPPPNPPGLLPNWTRSATISVRYFFSPDVLSSHDLVWILPSMRTFCPFLRYCADVSACLPNTTTLWKSVDSCFAPFIFPNAIGSDRHRRNIYTRRQSTELWVAGEISDNESFVEIHICFVKNY
jgi:hypothetical protein